MFLVTSLIPRHVILPFLNSGHMTRLEISGMAAMFGTLLAACLLLFSGVSGFPLGQETEQARSCGYEVRFALFYTLIS